MVNVQCMLDIIILTIPFRALSFSFHNKNAESTSSNGRVTYMDPLKINIINCEQTIQNNY